MGSDTKGILHPRAPRFELRVPIVIQLPEGMVKGRSLNISESGMGAVFDDHLDVWLAGRLFVMIEDLHLSINVRVARVQDREAGLTFQVATDGDRITIQKLIEHAIATGAPPYGDAPPQLRA